LVFIFCNAQLDLQEFDSITTKGKGFTHYSSKRLLLPGENSIARGRASTSLSFFLPFPRIAATVLPRVLVRFLGAPFCQYRVDRFVFDDLLLKGLTSYRMGVSVGRLAGFDQGGAMKG